MAGLLAARVLANHFGRVIVLERDPLTDDGHPRKGVPQAHHVHVLLDGGLRVIEDYFPGFVDEMMRDGIEPIGWSEDTRWYQSGTWKTRLPCGLKSYPQGRVALERRVRARLGTQHRVEIRTESNVQSLLYDAANESVTGVRVIRAGQQTELAADLVVDATGRGSRVLKWLVDLGYQAPPRETISIDLVYVSRIYQQTAESRSWKALACHPLPDVPRGAVLSPLDSERWILTLFGYLGEHPTTSPDDILRFLRDLSIPDVYNAVSAAKPLSEPVRFGYPVQVRRRFDRLKRFPAGLLVVGDAACSLDPVFGQGMTVACQEARALDRLLGANTDPQLLRKRFFSGCQKIIETPWLITKSEALRFMKMPGKRPASIRVMQWYTRHVFDLSAESVEVYRAFLDVMHLLAGPEAMFRPTVVRRVLGQALDRDFALKRYANH
jgi:2-polyprenyl-6-methoxyphenol hydroxylase-like FAD-dependent oxidoreductase